MNVTKQEPDGSLAGFGGQLFFEYGCRPEPRKSAPRLVPELEQG